MNFPGFQIIIDTREQLPYEFRKVLPASQIKSSCLATGDYSLAGFESQVCVERKSLADLYGSVGQGRKRFERELARMKSFHHSAIVCESDWVTILRCPPNFSRLNPKSLLGSIIAWTQRYNVQFWPCPNRAFAERVTFKILDRFYRDQKKIFEEL